MLHLTSLPLWANVAIFVAAALIVWVAGSRLAHYADAIARRTHIGQALLGMVLLGAVTSLPELAVAVTSGIAGTPALSTNDVLGSAGTNIVVLALADAFVRKRPLSSLPGSAPLLLQGTLGILLFALTLGPTIAGDRVIFGLSVWSWLLVGGYVMALRMLSSTHAEEMWNAVSSLPADEPQRRAEGDAPGEEAKARSARRLALTTIAAALAILVAGFLLARTGEALAEQTGLGTSFFGVAFLAVATSLPEVSTVIAAVRIHRYEMAIADVLGTNLFNVTIIALNDALYRGPRSVLLEVGPTAAFGALLALALTVVYLVGMIERRDRTFLRFGYDSIAIVLMYAAGMFVLYALR